MKRALCLLALVLLIAGTLTAAIALDAASLTDFAPDTGTFTVSGFVTSSQTNMLLIAGIGYNSSSGNRVSTFTHNGDNLTRLAGAGTNSAGSEYWYRKSPDVATADIVATLVDNRSGLIGAISLYGVDQTTTFRGAAQNSLGSGTSATALTFSGSPGDLLVDCIFARNGTPGDPGNLVPSSGTQIDADADELADTNLRMQCRYQVFTGTSIDADWSWTTSSDYSQTGAVIIPSSDAGIFIYQRYRRNAP
jgi:hypothetical protein